MNKLVRGLLSGASLATLQLCAVGVARASAPLVINAATGAVTVTAGQSPDYIQVTNTGAITGDLTNEGSVDVGAGSGIAIDVQGTISGALVNAAAGVIGGTGTGIYVHGATASIAGGIDNAGKILVGNTTATGGNHYANAISYNSQSVASITNTGTIGVNVQVIGTTTGYARATAKGVYEYVDGGNVRNVVETFAGTGGAISLTAAAQARSHIASAEAYAESAIKQRGFVSSSISQAITNSGDLALSAQAKATATNNHATARAYAEGGLYQDAGNNASHTAGATFTQAITNSGSISLAAAATASAAGKLIDFAEATGAIEQSARNAQTISQSIDNSGDISLIAKAKAVSTAYEAYDVSAQATDAFEQYAYNNFSHAAGAAITQSITNTGSVALSATASANSPYFASAKASAEEAVNQYADNAQTISQSIDNSGDVSLVANVKAVSVSSEAYNVSAFAGDAFSQEAYNNSVLADSKITQTITNSGTISLAASATASAPKYVSASATAEEMFGQFARNAVTISQSIDNTGDLSLVAKAKAISLSSEIEDFKAFARDVFSQYAQDNTRAADSAITQKITNSGSVSLTASAAGHAADYISASAKVERVFYQDAGNALTISQTLTNTGDISMSANAKATSTAYEAEDVQAVVGRVAMQSAYIFGSSAPGGSITQSVTNSGSVALAATAAAKALDYASASATAEYGFKQNANLAPKISQAITNTGAFSFSAKAKAVSTGTSYNAQASAFAGNAFWQRATADKTLGSSHLPTEGSTITQSITNSGSLSLTAVATAQAAEQVTANASVAAAFYQEANRAQTIIQSVTNSGSLSFDAAASAKGMARIDASAKLEGISYQDGKGDTIGQTLANSGSIDVDLAGTAVGAATTTNTQARVTAKALMSDGFGQQAYAFGGSNAPGVSATQSITNSGTFSMTAAANAMGGYTAKASAGIEGQVFDQYAQYFGTITETIDNTGSISIADSATAKNGANEAWAKADVDHLFEQRARQNGDPLNVATLTMTNGASIVVTQNATAVDDSFADARAQVGAVVDQELENVTSGSASATNSGSILISNHAKASGASFADAYANGQFVDQYAYWTGSSAADAHVSLSVSNSGTVGILADAKATAGISGTARANVTGVKQDVTRMSGTEAFDNSGTIQLAAVATALPGTPGAGVTATTTRPAFVEARAIGLSAKAYGSSGVFHTGSTSHVIAKSAPLTLAIDNSGTLDVAATANGNTLAFANIEATATGMRIAATSEIAFTQNITNTAHMHASSKMTVWGGGVVKGAVDNSGTLSVSASADGGVATANGITIAAGAIDATVTNAKGGHISVEASGATAQAVGIAEFAYGYAQRYHELTQNAGTSLAHYKTHGRTNTQVTGAATHVTGAITNNGTINVSATSTGDNIGNGEGGGEVAFLEGSGPSASDIKARAEGIAVDAEKMSAEILNTGTINVAAVGPDAVANGIHVYASQHGSHTGYTETHKYRGTATGFASTTQRFTTPLRTVLEDGKFTGAVTNSGTMSVSAKGAGAAAKGVLLEDASYDGAFVNSGKIVVTASGSGASAVGVEIDATALGSGASFQNNGGTISATLNGKWGSAIDVSGAPSALDVDLNGGSIFGNVVENADGNAVSVRTGNLVLDGMINPSKAKIGSLLVGRYGTLSLANDGINGNASAYVNSFNQVGTLAITGAADGGSGSIHAGNATLSGAAIVNLDLEHGIYSTGTTYEVVFSDADLSGTWSSVAPASAKTFFSASGVYTANEADITLTRATFDSIAGLTDNERAVAGAIETIYDTSGLSGDLGKLVGALFNLSPSQYAQALEDLSGIPVGELTAVDQSAAQSFLDQINSHLGGTSGGGDGGVASLMAPGSTLLAANNGAPSNVAPAQATSLSGTNVWGGGFQSGNSVDRTASGPAYSSHQSGLLAGIDVPVSQNLLVGVAASWSTGDIKTENMAGFGTFNAGLFAGYARFVSDSGLYAMGDVSYGDFTNRITRYVAIPGFGAGNVRGKFDSTSWGLYGETGWKLNPTGTAMSLTPYAAISYLDAKSDGYTETGSFGAPLTIAGSSSKATSSYLGVKLSTDWQLDTAVVTPRITAAWQHDFTRNAWEMGAAFAAVPTVGFGLTGADLSRDGAYVDAGVTLGIADSVSVLIDYQGRFTSDRTDNAFLARANFKFW